MIHLKLFLSLSAIITISYYYLLFPVLLRAVLTVGKSSQIFVARRVTNILLPRLAASRLPSDLFHVRPGCLPVPLRHCLTLSLFSSLPRSFSPSSHLSIRPSRSLARSPVPVVPYCLPQRRHARPSIVLILSYVVAGNCVKFTVERYSIDCDACI